MEPIPDESRRILFVDAFDSFTNNIVGLLEQSLNAQVTVVHIDNTLVSRDLLDVLTAFDAIVIGPGPGHPANASDVGFITKIWELSEADIVPVLGICLGFQSLCLAHSAGIKRLRQARHGIVSRPCHSETDVFAGLHDLETTQYHSLHVDLRHGRDVESPVWEPSESCPDLLPLAWDTTDDFNGPILMGVRHTKKPFWGVQFHPESICTSSDGKRLIENWWTHAQNWRTQHGRVRMKMQWLSYEMPPAPSTFPSAITTNGSSTMGTRPVHFIRQLRATVGDEHVTMQWSKHIMGRTSPTTLLEELSYNNDEVVVLDSQGHASGRFSIIGLILPGNTVKVTYHTSERMLRYGLVGGQMFTVNVGSIEQVWPLLQDVLDASKPCQSCHQCSQTGHPEDVPFWGGFMGYISYEAGLETIDVEPHPSCAESDLPDINFVFVDRSIVFDHQTGDIYVQSILPNDQPWITETGAQIAALAQRTELQKHNTEANAARDIILSAETEALNAALANAKLTRPSEPRYRSEVLQCQQYLASGDSYELCLTSSSTITTPPSSPIHPWSLYKRLRANNPAPFGAYLHLSDTVIVGSSPERFLFWSRSGHVQFRPIKGTVKKGDGMTREKAEEILGSSKERAENLMIVDLIRHDLSGVIGAKSVEVSKLMVVEEYERVWQLVSVVEGQLPKPENSDGRRGAKIRMTGKKTPTGIDVLKASLPPGSMTGAPKKRSCQILADIEERPRGVYSGVLGYMDVGGGGDFSVVIRTAFREKKRCDASGTPREETWRIGAGGAVTIQSTDEGEFQEMEVKASSVLGALFDRK